MGGKPESIFFQRLQRIADNSQNILDIGTSQRFAKELRKYEPLFEGKNYIAAGFKPAMDYGDYNCDCHQDIEAMNFADGSFDAIICLEVLEHVQNPFQASKEIKRVLREGGQLLLTAPFLSQYHGKGSTSQSHDAYPDYWRFTHEGLSNLFNEFKILEIIPLDGPIEFRLKQFYVTKLLSIPPVRKIIDLIDRPKIGKATTRHLLIGTK